MGEIGCTAVHSKLRLQWVSVYSAECNIREWNKPNKLKFISVSTVCTVCLYNQRLHLAANQLFAYIAAIVKPTKLALVY